MQLAKNLIIVHSDVNVNSGRIGFFTACSKHDVSTRVSDRYLKLLMWLRGGLPKAHRGGRCHMHRGDVVRLVALPLLHLNADFNIKAD